MTTLLIFLLLTSLVAAITYFKTRDSNTSETNKVEVKPWKYSYEAGIIITAIMITFFIIFSKLGLAGGTWSSFGTAMGILWLLTLVGVVGVQKLKSNKLQ